MDLRKLKEYYIFIPENTEDLFYLNYIVEKNDILEGIIKKEPDINTIPLRPIKEDKINELVKIRIVKVYLEGHFLKLKGVSLKGSKYYLFKVSEKKSYKLYKYVETRIFKKIVAIVKAIKIFKLKYVFFDCNRISYGFLKRNSIDELNSIDLYTRNFRGFTEVLRGKNFDLFFKTFVINSRIFFIGLDLFFNVFKSVIKVRKIPFEEIIRGPKNISRNLLYEVLNMKIINSVFKTNRVLEEINTVNKIFAGKWIAGINAIKNSNNLNNVKKVIVTITFINNLQIREFILRLLIKKVDVLILTAVRKDIEIINNLGGIIASKYYG